MNRKILYPDLSYKLTGLCFKVHKELGRFCSERQYADLLERLLKENNFIYMREYEIKNLNPASPHGSRVDFLIENKILVDVKAKKFITKEDHNQMQRYLQASGLELGLIVNFRNTYLKPKRVLNTKLHLDRHIGMPRAKSGDGVIRMYSDNSDGGSDYSDRYEILEHTADLKIRVFGKTKEELFENAMIGMFESAKYQKEGKKIKREIKVSSSDLTSLLVDFLGEVLYLSEVNQEVYRQIQFKKFSEKEIEGILIGKKLKRIGVQIKGATYHDLEIKQKKDKIWEATVLFDI